MATAEKEVLDVNQLYRLKDGKVGSPSELYHYNTRIKEACIRRGNSIIKVYNIANYYLTIPDGVLVEPSGVEPTFDYESYKVNHDGTREDGMAVSITWDPELAPNTEEGKIVEGVFRVEQIVSGLVLTGAYTQNGSDGYYEYYNISAYYAIYPRIAASGTNGEWIRISVSYSYVERYVKVDGTYTDTTKYGTATTCRIVSYNHGDHNSHAQIDTGTGRVYADSLYNNQFNQELTLFTINSLEIDITLDKTYTLTYDLGVSCVQQENIPKTTTTYAIASCIADPSTVFAIGGEVKVTVDATKTTATVWTSKYEENPVTEMDYATVESDVCSFPYGSTINSDGYVLATVPEWAQTTNRTFAFTAYSSDRSVSMDSNTVTQYADTEEYKWGSPIITAITSDLDIPANGMGIPILAVYTQYKYKITQTGGSEVVETIEGARKNVDSLSGVTLVSGTSVNGAVISANNLGTTVRNRRNVYMVSSVTMTSNGVSATSSGLTYSVYQQANAIIDTSTRYTLSMSRSGSPISVFGGSATINVDAYSIATNTYTSGSVAEADPVAARATLSTKPETVGVASGTLGASSITGTGSTTFTIDSENYNTSANSHSITAVCGDKSQTVYVEQSESVYEFRITSAIPTADAAASTVSFDVLSTRNGGAQEFVSTDVSISGLSDVGVSVVNNGSGSYSVKLSVPANEDSAERSFNVTIRQPHSLYSVSTEVKQNGATEAKEMFKVTLKAITNSSYTPISYELVFDATDTTKYDGGQVEDVSLQLAKSSTGANPFYNKHIADYVNVTKGNSVTYTGEIPNSGGSLVYVVLYYDNNLQAYAVPVMPVD